MPQDMNDMRMDPDTMDDAARVQPPISVANDANRAKMADDGLARMTAIVEAMEVAQGKADRLELWAAAFATDTTEVFRAARFAHKPEWHALRLRLKAMSMATEWATLDRHLNDAQTTDAAPKSLARLIGEPRSKLSAPPGYIVDERGVWERGEERMTQIATAPVVIRAIANEPGSSVVRLQLAWKVGRAWSRKSVDRYHAMDARSLVRLASDGCPVHSGNALELVKYLAAFESHNIAALPTIEVTRHMGWTGDHFLWGERCLTGDMRLTADDGLMQRARGYTEGGTWDGWCAAVERLCCPSPLAMLGIYVAACAPLLRLLAAPSFVFDLSGETSHGKSTVMQVWGSVWGDPRQVVGSWASSSTVGPAMTAWFLQSMPVMLDDTKRGNDADIASVMYDLPAGQERIKGTADGSLRELKRWHTLLMSNGEAPITSFTRDAGAHARCLCVQGDPVQNGDQARAIDDAFRAHFGHLGPRVVAEALRDPDALTARYRRYRDHYASPETAKSNVAGRMAAYVAAIRVAADLCSIVGCPHPKDDPIEYALAAMRDGSASADKPREAIEAVMTWAVTHRSRLWSPGARDPGVIGWAGLWQGADLGLTSAALTEVLTGAGFKPADVVKGWAARGWLVSRDGNQTQRRIDGKATRLYLFAPGVVDEFTG